MSVLNIVEVVQFNERFCGRKVIKEQIKQPKEKEISERKANVIDKVKEFNIKRARYEVMRFGLSGFDKERQKKDKIALAIRLGAKPPKKDYVNYKLLMEEKKKEIAERKKQTDQYTVKQLKRRKQVKTKKTKNPYNIL